MHPYTWIGGCKIFVVDFNAGIVVPKSDARNRYFDDGNESITLAQTTFVELLYIFKGYV
jgi:hypothetical protein